MKKILLSDQVDESSISILKSAGFELDYSSNNSPETLLQKIKNNNALVLRSAIKVNYALIDEMNAVEVIGRAGAGADNIDVPAAIRKGNLVQESFFSKESPNENNKKQ